MLRIVLKNVILYFQIMFIVFSMSENLWLVEYQTQTFNEARLCGKAWLFHFLRSLKKRFQKLKENSRIQKFHISGTEMQAIQFYFYY